MFRQDNQSTVALTLEYTHSYDIFHANGPTTTTSQTWRTKVNSMKQLRREFCDLSEAAEELQESLDKNSEKNSQHIAIKINGTINHSRIADLQLETLDAFREFIVQHQPTVTQSSSPPQQRPSF